jgi:hypothetical protein
LRKGLPKGRPLSFERYWLYTQGACAKIRKSHWVKGKHPLDPVGTSVWRVQLTLVPQRYRRSPQMTKIIIETDDGKQQTLTVYPEKSVTVNADGNFTQITLAIVKIIYY